MSSPPSDPLPPAPRRGGGRVAVIDWLRGIAVVTMIVAHSYDAWLAPAERVGAAWAVIRHVSGIPSRLFLFLVGVSAAVVFEHQGARGLSPSDMRRHALKRGAGMLALAYLFRLQEHALAGFWGGWVQVFRVDILNCIAVSIMLVGVLGAPARTGGPPRFWLPLGAAAVFVALGPFVGPAHFPTWLPRFLTSYVGGQRPMSWFPIFPWGAWALVGLVIGQIWLRASRGPDGGRGCFIVTGVLGTLSLGTVQVIRDVAPNLVPYPSELVQQMGGGSFFFRLGVIGVLALAGWLWTTYRDARRPGRFSVLTQLGQTSLLIYWVHVDICYGFGTKPLQKRLGFLGATIGFLLVTAAMLALSVAKTRLAPTFRPRWKAFLARLRRQPPGMGVKAESK